MTLRNFHLQEGKDSSAGQYTLSKRHANTLNSNTVGGGVQNMVRPNIMDAAFFDPRYIRDLHLHHSIPGFWLYRGVEASLLTLPSSPFCLIPNLSAPTSNSLNTVNVDSKLAPNLTNIARQMSVRLDFPSS